MKLLNTIINFISPETCVGCAKEGLIICNDCRQGFLYTEQCMHCKKPSVGGLTCVRCRPRSSVNSFYAASSYSGLAKKLVLYMKYHPSSSSAHAVGEIVSSKLPYLEPHDTIVTYIPTTPSRVRERGFDQSMIIAKSLARSRRLHFCPTLRRLTKSHQVGSNKKDRLQHMAGAFVVKNRHLIEGKTVILVDDVITTGSTLESAAKELKNAGAKKILAVVFARAE